MPLALTLEKQRKGHIPKEEQSNVITKGFHPPNWVQLGRGGRMWTKGRVRIGYDGGAGPCRGGAIMTYMHCNHCGRERQHKWIGEQDMPKGKFDWYVCCKCNDSQAVAQSGFVVLSDDPNTGQTVATWGQAKIYPTKEQVRDIMAVPGKWESGKRKAEVPVQKRRGLFG